MMLAGVGLPVVPEEFKATKMETMKTIVVKMEIKRHIVVVA